VKSSKTIKAETEKREAGLKAAATQGKAKNTGLKTGHYRRKETGRRVRY